MFQGPRQPGYVETAIFGFRGDRNRAAFQSVWRPSRWLPQLLSRWPYVFVRCYGNRPNPRDADPTDEEKLKLQGSMIAYAGTYTVNGEAVFYHVDISWNQSWTGTHQVRFYKLDGDTLTLTTAPARSPINGQERKLVVVYKKIQ